MKDRIYVCHTYYHVYVTCLKELALPAGQRGRATLVLSTMSNDFGNLRKRAQACSLFEEVVMFDEKEDTFFPKLQKYHTDRGNLLLNMLARMKYTKMFGRLEKEYIPVDFGQYRDIYVFCDSDPIGYYLNYKHIFYHAVEDGLDCLKNLDDAYVANHGHFRLKTWFSRLNLIFIMNGWGKYCLDMEINDRSKVPTDCPRFVEVPRKPLEQALTPPQKKLMIQAFIEDADKLMEQLKPTGEEIACFLTEPHPVDVEARKRVCLDVIEQYCRGYKVLIKPHPRDMIDYKELCPQAVVLRGRFPVEVMNFFEGLHIKRAVSIVTTALNNMDFVDEKINLGASFWDAYEDPEKHAYNKKAGLALADK